MIIGLVALLLTGPAVAREVQLPDLTHKVSVQFPDNWVISKTDVGSEAAAPDKKAFVIMKVLTRETDDPNKWVKQALARLEALGVHFETKQTSAPPAVLPPAAKEAGSEARQPGTTSPEAPKPNAVDGPQAAKPPLTIPTFAMNANTIEALPARELVRHALTYRGSSMDGGPVDVELVTFTLSNSESFFMLQESGPTDDRAISIIKSVKRAP